MTKTSIVRTITDDGGICAVSTIIEYFEGVHRIVPILFHNPRLQLIRSEMYKLYGRQ